MPTNKSIFTVYKVITVMKVKADIIVSITLTVSLIELVFSQYIK